MNFRFIISSAVFSLLLGATSYASIVPVDPGESYRLVFVWSGSTQALNTGSSYYDGLVQGAATSAGLPSPDDWTAIISIEGIDARDHTGTNPNSVGVPIFLVDGTPIALDNSDLWDGGIINSLNVDENGDIQYGLVWTGTIEYGGLDINHTLGSAEVTVGSSWSGDGRWLADDVFSAEGGNALYGMSSVLTAPGEGGVPEPTSLLVWGLLGIGVVAGRRRRKQAIHS